VSNIDSRPTGDSEKSIISSATVGQAKLDPFIFSPYLLTSSFSSSDVMYMT